MIVFVINQNYVFVIDNNYCFCNRPKFTGIMGKPKVMIDQTCRLFLREIIKRVVINILGLGGNFNVYVCILSKDFDYIFLII